MATPLDPKQVVSFEELLMSQVVSQDALIRLLILLGLMHSVQWVALQVFGIGFG